MKTYPTLFLSPPYTKNWKKYNADWLSWLCSTQSLSISTYPRISLSPNPCLPRSNNRVSWTHPCNQSWEYWGGTRRLSLVPHSHSSRTRLQHWESSHRGSTNGTKEFDYQNSWRHARELHLSMQEGNHLRQPSTRSSHHLFLWTMERVSIPLTIVWVPSWPVPSTEQREAQQEIPSYLLPGRSCGTKG